MHNNLYFHFTSYLSIVLILSIFSNITFAKDFDGEKLFLMKDRSMSQILSIVILTKNNHLIIFDGGMKKDADHLESFICNYGGKVSAWFLTHPHPDHTGALAEILERKKITIEKIYYNFPPYEWVKQYEPSDLGPFLTITNALKKSGYQKKQYILHKGDTFDIDHINIAVLNDINLSITENPINNASIVFSVYVSGKRLLILGDLGKEAGELLLAEYGNQLKSDIVQMSHHGQHGVDRDVYAAIHPEICLWPTPEWLWENNGGNGPSSGVWVINQVKCWMEHLGVKRHYVSGKHEDDIIIE